MLVRRAPRLNLTRFDSCVMGQQVSLTGGPTYLESGPGLSQCCSYQYGTNLTQMKVHKIDGFVGAEDG